jgi:hypothetical protein
MLGMGNPIHAGEVNRSFRMLRMRPSGFSNPAGTGRTDSPWRIHGYRSGTGRTYYLAPTVDGGIDACISMPTLNRKCGSTRAIGASRRPIAKARPMFPPVDSLVGAVFELGYMITAENNLW